MECVIQVFPDEMHLATLNNFLGACAQLHPSVNVKNIIISLIDRLAQYAQREDESGGIPSDIQLFDIFSKEIEYIISDRRDMPPEDIVSLQVSLINMAHKCYPERVDYVDTVLEVTKKLFDNIDLTRVEYSTPVGRELEKLLKIPINNFGNMLTVLQLAHFVPLISLYDFEGRKAMSCYIADDVVETETYIPSVEQVEILLSVLAPLAEDQSDGPTANEWEDPEEFVEEQGLMGRVIHLLRSPNPDMQYQILSCARKHLGQGGPKRIGFTLPPIVVSAFQLSKQFHDIRETVSFNLYRLNNNSILILVLTNHIALYDIYFICRMKSGRKKWQKYFNFVIPP